MANFYTKQGREFLKDTFRKQVDFSQTDQARGEPVPPLEKPFDETAKRIALIKSRDFKNIEAVELRVAINRRRSRRNFSNKPLNLEELSFLLWAAQGVQRVFGRASTFRTVPSAGGRHTFETYLCVTNVEGLGKGIYRYLPIEHELLLVKLDDNVGPDVARAALNQDFAAQAAVTFVWATIPYRMEWRYGAASHKSIAIDAGHVCQNLYLACEAIGAGCCAVAAYNQSALDTLLGIDGEDEFAVYLAAVGKN
jgi:SagB-type dehydrogenase family enzyme